MLNRDMVLPIAPDTLPGWISNNAAPPAVPSSPDRSARGPKHVAFMPSKKAKKKRRSQPEVQPHAGTAGLRSGKISVPGASSKSSTKSRPPYAATDMKFRLLLPEHLRENFDLQVGAHPLPSAVDMERYRALSARRLESHGRVPPMHDGEGASRPLSGRECT
jgi:hypothetical protein